MSAPTRFAGTTGHPKGEVKTGFAVGIDHGKVVTKLEMKPKPSYRKGVRARHHTSTLCRSPRSRCEPPLLPFGAALPDLPGCWFALCRS